MTAIFRNKTENHLAFEDLVMLSSQARLRQDFVQQHC